MRRLLLALGVLAGIVVAFVLFLFLKPLYWGDADGEPRPAATYEEAIARYEAVQAAETALGSDLLPECRSRLLGGGERTERVIVLFHGYTNCPEQYRELADRLVGAGYTVYVPRMPEHGESDREHTTLDRLTTEELIAWGNESVDIAAGLGEDVTLLGLSGGGTVTAYLAQFRDEVDHAVAMAPFLGLPWSPEWLVAPLVNLGDVLPPIGLGVPASEADATGQYAPYAYYDNNLKAALAFVRLGQITLAEAARSPHAAGETLTVINEADTDVSNAMIEVLERRWATLAANDTDTYRFPLALDLPHDLIGPDRADQRIDEVYPVILELLGAD